MDWKSATISNNFMFRLVMEKQELCKPLIERILDIKIMVNCNSKSDSQQKVMHLVTVS